MSVYDEQEFSDRVAALKRELAASDALLARTKADREAAREAERSRQAAALVRQATSSRTAAARGSVAEQGERATRRFDAALEKVLPNIGYEGQSREERLADLSETWQTNPELVTAMFEAEEPGIEREMEAFRVRLAREKHDAETGARTAAAPALEQIPGLSKYIDATTGENVLQSAFRESLGDPDIVQSTKIRLFRKIADPVNGDPDTVVEALAGDAIRARDEEASQRLLFDHYLPSLPSDGAPSPQQKKLDGLTLDELESLMDTAPEPTNPATKWIDDPRERKPTPDEDESARVIRDLERETAKLDAQHPAPKPKPSVDYSEFFKTE